MSSNANTNSNSREIRRIPMACAVCRRRKLKCRPSLYQGICQRCVEDNVVEQCIFVPVAGPPENVGHDDAFYSPRNQDHAHSFAAPQLYAPQSVPAQHPYYFPTNQPTRDPIDGTFAQNLYGQTDATSYAQQSVYQQPLHTLPSYPAAWPTQAQHGSQSRDQSTFGPGTPAASYPLDNLANYGHLQGNNPANNPTNNPSNWTGTTDEYSRMGYMDPNGNYYSSHAHDQPEGDSEPKE